MPIIVGPGMISIIIQNPESTIRTHKISYFFFERRPLFHRKERVRLPTVQSYMKSSQ